MPKQVQMPRADESRTHQRNVTSIIENSPKVQHERFVEVARALGCSESEAAFEATLQKVAKSPPIKR